MKKVISKLMDGFFLCTAWIIKGTLKERIKGVLILLLVGGFPSVLEAVIRYV